METGHINGLVSGAATPGVNTSKDSALGSSGFCVLLQKADLNIDFVEKLLEGRTEITIQPLNNTLSTIRLDSRYCEIHRVSVAGKRASFIQHDPFSNLRVP